MRRLRRIRRLRRSGTTLVEMIVTLLLFGIMMTMAIGILSPAAKVFVRIQRLHNAQIILENTVQELRGLTRSAAGNIKIYDHCGAAADPVGEQGVTGDIGGLALEFVNEEGYINLEIRNLIPLRTERWNPDGCLPDIMSGIYKENPTVTIIGMQAVRPSALLHRYSPTVIIWGIT